MTFLIGVVLCLMASLNAPSHLLFGLGLALIALGWPALARALDPEPEPGPDFDRERRQSRSRNQF